MKMASFHSGLAKCWSVVSSHFVLNSEQTSYQSNCNRDNRPQEVDHERQRAAALEGNLQELEWVEPSPATLTIRMDALSDLMPVVVVLRQRLRTTIPSTVRGVLSRSSSWFLVGVFAR